MNAIGCLLVKGSLRALQLALTSWAATTSFLLVAERICVPGASCALDLTEDKLGLCTSAHRESDRALAFLNFPYWLGLSTIEFDLVLVLFYFLLLNIMSGIGSGSTLSDQNTTKDSYIPLFSGSPHDYREWRKRIKIYITKMRMLKKEPEGLLNLIGSLSGTAWRLMESFDISEVEKDGCFNKIMKIVDRAFEYDNRVQLPGDYDRYFVTLQRRPGQTMLDYCTTVQSMTSSTTGCATTQ